MTLPNKRLQPTVAAADSGPLHLKRDVCWTALLSKLTFEN